MESGEKGLDLRKGSRSHSHPQCPEITSVNININHVYILAYFLCLPFLNMYICNTLF